MLYYDKRDNSNLKIFIIFFDPKAVIFETDDMYKWMKKGGVRFHENSETRYDRQLSVDGFIFFV